MVDSTGSGDALATVWSDDLEDKGLKHGSVGALASVVLGVASVAPAYALTATLGPTVSEVGLQMPAIFLAGFIPMLLVAYSYREFNKVAPDAGTSFTWTTKAFGPHVGWMGGWGAVMAMIVVLSNLAGVAVSFLYLMLGEIFGSRTIATLGDNVLVNILTCLAFIAVAMAISYRGMTTSKAVQYALVGLQMAILALFVVLAFAGAIGGASDVAIDFSLSWLNPFAAGSFAALAGPVMGGLAILIFVAVLISSAASLQATFVAVTRTMLAMGFYKTAPERLAHVHPRYQVPSFSTLFAGIGTAVFYAVMRVVSEDALIDTIYALGLMICFYYGLTAFGCVWYFRRELFASPRNFLFPGLGGVMLALVFLKTAVDTWDPAYGAGGAIFGVGTVFVIGVGILLLGVVLMFVWQLMAPEFFKGEVLRHDTPILVVEED